jgi:flagellar basal body-associated protein FliL
LSLIGSIVTVILGCMSATLPLEMSTMGGQVPPDGLVMLILFSLPSVVLFLVAAGLYAYAHRQPSATVKRNIQRSRSIAAKRARFTLASINRARSSALRYLIAAILTAAAARVITSMAPHGSPIVGLAQAVMYLMVYVVVLMGAAFVVWYAFSQTTLAAQADERLSPQAMSKAKERSARLDKAHKYQTRIREAIAQAHEGQLRDRLQSATERLDEWVAHVEHITARLGELERDPVLRRDLSTVPRAVDSLEARLSLEQDTDVGVRDAVRQTLAARQSQLRQLRALERLKVQAELYSEETIAALGAIYSEILLVDAKDIEGGRAQRLRADIDEQVKSLRDLLDAMDEVQGREQDAAA